MFFTILLQLMLSTRLLQPIVDGKKIIIIVIFSNRKQKVTLNLGFVIKNIVNVALLKKKKNNNKSLVSKLLLVFI